MIELAEIEAARERIAGAAVRTPLVRLHVEDAPAEIYLKLENLQPINSFKIRGATNAIMLAPAAERAKGLVTASAGNMAQGVAWAARELGLPATIAVPEHAPEAKLAAIERLGGRVLKLPYDDWWNVIVTSQLDGVEGLFVHPVQDPGGDGRQRDDRAGDPGGPARPGRDRDPVRRRRPDRRHRQRDQGAAAGHEDRHRRARDRRRAGRGARGRAARPTSTTSASFVDGSGSRRVLDSMWPLVAAARRPAPWPSRSATSPRPCACSPSGSG